MPVTKSARKKLRQDKKRTVANQTQLAAMKKAVKAAQKKKAGDLSVLFSAIDKAVKNNLLHKNKAAHMKSRLAKTVKNTAKAAVKTAKAVNAPAKPKTTAKKATVKK